MTEGRARALLLLSTFAVLALTMPAERMYGDPVFPQRAARALVEQGQLHVSGDARALRAAGGNFVHNPKTDRWYSKWGVPNTLLFVAPTALHEALRGGAVRDDTLYVLCLNGLNILCGLLLAALLFGLLRPYCAAPGRRLLYTLLVLFSTFVWYYLRAQSIDLFHLVLFAAYLRALFAWQARPRPWLLAAAAAALGGCILAKSSFLLFVPSFFALIVLALPPAARTPRAALRAAAPAVPVLILVGAALLSINQHKFGSWLASGYHQNIELQNLPLLDSSPLSSLYLALFDVQRGLLVSFWPLLLGALYLARFWRRFRWDALAILVHVVPQLLLVALVAPLWHGEWCYGPRLLLFLVPLLALPGALAFESTDPAPSPRSRRMRRIAVGAVAAFSLLYQLKVNLMPFHHYYELERLVARHQDPRYRYRVDQFMHKTHPGEIYDSFLALAQGGHAHKALSLIRLHRPDLHARLVRDLQRHNPGINLLLFR